MASSDKSPEPTPPYGEQQPPGAPMTMHQHLLDKGAQMMQSLKPIKQMNQHCAVYDTDDSSGRLIGVEYIVSDKIFEALPPEEQKLWHSHAYEIKSGLWVNPRVPEMIVKPDLENLTKTYGKFWCTWQVDRASIGSTGTDDVPQGVNLGMVDPELVQKRDNKYNISTEAMKSSRVEIRRTRVDQSTS
ncbi:hypothetical protein Patl1_10335 [Pistacia atlantica]|uniref:Uncharacterized protein n=1 Tax=Pistacia atlantica TaxID=434234 RepID=A0ACC1A0J2_9ROSI|nr:hypothetical protein Patl1_10335 [Pistacia atlantica]